MLKSGDKVNVKVTSIASFGAFCDVLSEEGVKGLIHISEFSDYFVNDINDFVKVGEEYEVEVISFDSSKKQAKLSFKNLRSELLKSGENSKLQESGSGFDGLKSSIDDHVTGKNK